MRKRFIYISVLSLTILTSNTDAVAEKGKISHFWRALSVVGVQFGMIDTNIENKFFGGNFYYNTGLTHFPERTPDRLDLQHSSNFGIIGSANYFIDDGGRMTATITPTVGAFIDEVTLLHGGIGFSYDSDRGYAISPLLTVTSKLFPEVIGNDNTFASIFIQMDYHSKDQNSILVGISIGGGRLITITDQ